MLAVPSEPPRAPLSRVVLITRPEPGANETAALLSARGLVPLIAPALVIRPLRSNLPPASELQAVLFTSGQAVARLGAAYHGVPVFAVGDATAARARAQGFAEVRSAAADAAALAALVRSLCPPAAGPLLLACGRGDGEALAEALRGDGLRVLRRVVYAAQPVHALAAPARRALAEGRIGRALFFSAASARAFAAQVGAADLAAPLAMVEALAIAEPVAAALRGLPWRAVRVAVRPTMESLLALL
ncbi:MAG: uroporphyrinogen-III synthase [Acetobacteraceae bacterium]